MAAWVDARIEPLQQRDERAARALGQAMRALALARNRWRCACALASFEAFSRTSSPAKRSRRLRSSERADMVSRSPPRSRRCSRLRDLAAQHPQRQPCAARGEAAEMRMRVGVQAAGQRRRRRASSRCRGIAEQLVRRRQRARGGAQLVAAALLAALPAGAGAPREAVDLDEQLAAHRHRHFGRRRRRRRALVGGEIDQRDVGLVADRGDQRDHAVGRGAHHDLLVERPEILERAAAARDDQQIGPRNACRPRAAR